jgi:hypothetical protein
VFFFFFRLLFHQQIKKQKAPQKIVVVKSIMTKSITPCKKHVRKTAAVTKTREFRPLKKSEKRVWSYILRSSNKQDLDEIVGRVPGMRTDKYYCFVRKLLLQAKNEIITADIAEKFKRDLDRFDYEDHNNRSAFLRTMSFRIDYKIPIKSGRITLSIVKLHRAFCVLEDQNGTRTTVKFGTSIFKKLLRSHSEFINIPLSFFVIRTLNFRFIELLMRLPIPSAVQSHVFKFLE